MAPLLTIVLGMVGYKMVKKWSWSGLLLFLLFSTIAQAIECEDLTTNQAIQNFVRQSGDSNPMAKKRISALLELSSCKEEKCDKSNRKSRRENKKILHMLKYGDNQRLNYLKGPQAQQCFIKRQEREFKCTSCDLVSNTACRSYKSTEKSTRFKGTNIDSTDFDLIEDEQHQSVCINLSDKYLKIVTERTGGASDYNKIISVYEKRREIPLLINFYAQDQLRKVYRFFPKYYTKIDNFWYSTYARVRTTINSEKKYKFETIVKVLKDRKNNFQLYGNPEKDPMVRDYIQGEIFKTSNE